MTTEKDVDTFCAGLTEAQFRECVAAVIADNRALDPGGRKTMLKLNPYKSPTLKRWVYDAFAEPPVSAPKPHWNVSAPQDLEL